MTKQISTKWVFILAVVFCFGCKNEANNKSVANQAEEKKIAAHKARFGDAPVASAWLGSFSEVEDYLKKNANDPKNIKVYGCTEVRITKDGWLVGCNYRDINASGEMDKKSNWFTIGNGEVVKIEPISAYKQ